ncbi:MAG: hypothetical protein ABSE36_06320 [Terracidiphilus sp.]|jgi:hypothetical protein
MSTKWIKFLFVVAGIYDLVFGFASVIAAPQIFRIAGVTPPNHWGYVYFPALLVIIFGIMFLRIAADPAGRLELIHYGMGLKAAYCGVVFWFDLLGNVPRLWIPFAWADLVFFVLFFFAWRALTRKA